MQYLLYKVAALSHDPWVHIMDVSKYTGGGVCLSAQGQPTS